MRIIAYRDAIEELEAGIDICRDHEMSLEAIKGLLKDTRTELCLKCGKYAFEEGCEQCRFK